MVHAFEALTRGLVLLGIIGFLAWRMYRRWRGATEYVNAMQEEERLQRASFARMPWDPHFGRLKGYVDSRYRATFERTTDPHTFRIHYATYQDHTSQQTWQALPAKWLVAYLKGKQGKLIVSLDLETGQVFERRAGFFDWDVVPNWAR